MLVHTDDCDGVANMHPENVVYFCELYHAMGDGYSECPRCFYWEELRAERAALRAKTRGKKYRKCLICSESRGIQRAHIKPKRHGGKECMPLCPNHHWGYDHDLLEDEEFLEILLWVAQEFSSALAKEIRDQYEDWVAK
jgi:hypothetical protein